MAQVISQHEVEYIVEGIQHGVRLDGRGRMDMRPVEVELGVVAQATGSARVRMGSTDVLVGVKVRVCVCVHQPLAAAAAARYSVDWIDLAGWCVPGAGHLMRPAVAWCGAWVWP